MKIVDSKYHLLIRILHWLMSFIILSLIVAGYCLANIENLPDKGTWYLIHKSMGISVLMLTVIRIMLRTFTVVPELPMSIPPISRYVSGIMHKLLYCFMIAIPLSGYLMSSYGGKVISYFGVVDIPSFVNIDLTKAGIFYNLHSWLPYILLGFLLLHVAGAVYHHVVDKLPLWRRII